MITLTDDNDVVMQGFLPMIFSHVDKIWFAKSKITKQDIIDYYDKISSYFLPLVKNHPIVLQRFPNGIDQDSFYQKNLSQYFPDTIDRTTVNLKKGGKQTLVMINNKESLLYLVNQATLVFHAWLSGAKNIDKPDRIVFDLDPAHAVVTKLDIKYLRLGAKKLKLLLEQYHLTPLVMTTGSRGFHVVVPIVPQHNFEKVHEFAKMISAQLVAQDPHHFTNKATKSGRRGKIFVDYLRNSYGQTSVACYSVRAYPKAPVATPIDWSELAATTPQKYTISNIFKRLAKKNTAWNDFADHAKKLKLT